MKKRIPATSRLILMIASVIGAAVIVAALAVSQAKGASDEQRHELKGKVVSVNLEKLRVTIEHEKIEGVMEAMTMPFTVKDKREIESLAKGDMVKATLVVDGDRMWLENIRKE